MSDLDGKGIKISRLYYPLEEAAEYLKCSIKDVIHLGAIGILKISIYIPHWNEKEGESFSVYYNGLVVDAEQYRYGDFLGLTGESWEIAGIYEYTAKDNDFYKQGAKLVKLFNGFFYLVPRNLTELEFDIDAEKIRVNTLFASDDFDSMGAVILDSPLGVKFPAKYLCVMLEELEGIEDKRGRMPSAESDRPRRKPNENKQAKMIKALIELQYGVGAADKARSLLNTERGTGEMLADFDRAGIRPPVSGRVLSEWIKDIDLETVGISTEKVDISKN
ncbi:hypothetical protein PVM12_21425 [Enterobacter soli]|uniref:hypothetical protein n=1 Tax=Enterobacter soli TaxID=885040 RepID=UPI002379F5B2|nr:hypothetical protein [Enterobacter soli]MDD9246576.1 hypothetical protein [Enterobacter soli]